MRIVLVGRFYLRVKQYKSCLRVPGSERSCLQRHSNFHKTACYLVRGERRAISKSVRQVYMAQLGYPQGLRQLHQRRWHLLQIEVYVTVKGDNGRQKKAEQLQTQRQFAHLRRFWQKKRLDMRFTVRRLGHPHAQLSHRIMLVFHVTKIDYVAS
mmetsp:Transcript_49895/g.116463  ORF Transcript_49895/g.116463 Transcript_49895/m.116463 type:complete len:154 (-) Transcript_49895:744-1205(-)